MRAALSYVIAIALATACGGGGGDGPGDGGAGRADASSGASIDAGPPGPTSVSFTSALTSSAPSLSSFVRGDASELYSVAASTSVLYSPDQGRSWEARGGMVFANLTRAPDGTLYANDSTYGIVRSTDGGRTFGKLTLPFVQTSGFVPLVRASADGTLLLAHRVAPAELYVSTNRGDSWTPAAATPAPLLTRDVELPATSDGYLYVIDNRVTVYRTKDGTAWEDLGTYNIAYKVFASTAGTIFLEIATPDVGLEELRSIDGGKHWSRRPASSVFNYLQRPNGQLVRAGQAVETSNDEGMTWDPLVAAKDNIVTYELIAYDDALVGLSATSLIRLPGGATTWDAPTPTTIPPGSDLQDVAFDAENRVYVAGKRQIFVSGTGGTSWHRGAHLFDDAEPLRAIAARPDGQRIFVGSTASRFWFTDGAGDQVVIASDVDRPTEPIQQAQWIGDARDHLLVFTTANSEDTAGIVLYSRGPSDDRLGWMEINPLQVSSNPGGRYTAGYHGIAITDAAPQGGSRSLYVGARQWFGTNAYMNHLRVQLKLLDSFDPWLPGETPIASLTPMTISQSGPYGQALALLYAGNQLFLYSFTGLPATEVAAAGVVGDLRAAKFDRAGRLWLVTSVGLYRSTQTFGDR